MVQVLSANKSTVNAIRKAHRLPNNLLPPGKQKLSPNQPTLAQSAKYSGPFACIIKDDTTITVKGFISGENDIRNNIYAGLTRLETVGDSDVTITGSGAVYMRLNWDDTTEAYTVNYEFYASFITQDSENIYILLAYVGWDSVNARISSITQIKKDEIHVAGRVV